jgi:hypothetical protein
MHKLVDYRRKVRDGSGGEATAIGFGNVMSALLLSARR